MNFMPFIQPVRPTLSSKTCRISSPCTSCPCITSDMGVILGIFFSMFRLTCILSTGKMLHQRTIIKEMRCKTDPLVRCTVTCRYSLALFADRYSAVNMLDSLKPCLDNICPRVSTTSGLYLSKSKTL